MKKILMTLAAILCCTGLSIQDAQAQQSSEEVDITFEKKEYKTMGLLYGFMQPRDYDGNDLRAGVINYVYNCKITSSSDPSTSKDIFEPDNPNYYITCTDPYGRSETYVNSKFIPNLILDLEITAPDYEGVRTQSMVILRGGQYVVKTAIPAFNYYNEDNLEIIDDPSMRFRLVTSENEEVTDIYAYYNTGYPYDASQFTGNEKAEVSLYALSMDEKGNVVETELASAEKILRLNRSDEPLVAAIDTIKLTNLALKKGDYVLKLKSDWDFDQANSDNYIFKIKGEYITAIRNLKADSATSREEWCDLQGRKFTRKPTAPGIYLRNGIKIVIE